MRILIVDDDVDTRELVELALRGGQVELVHAADGNQLVAQIDSHAVFDLIITDIHMPVRDGLDAITAIRARGVTTPVLVISGQAGPAIVAAVDAVQGAALLAKPFGIAQLRRAVAALLAETDA